jgi:hypothetical protein
VFYCGVPGNTSCTGALGNTFGNLGRNVVIGPGFSNVDIALAKNTKITERLTWQIRADAFDILNHANFGQLQFRYARDGDVQPDHRDAVSDWGFRIVAATAIVDEADVLDGVLGVECQHPAPLKTYGEDKCHA